MHVIPVASCNLVFEGQVCNCFCKRRPAAVSNVPKFPEARSENRSYLLTFRLCCFQLDCRVPRSAGTCDQPPAPQQGVASEQVAIAGGQPGGRPEIFNLFGEQNTSFAPENCYSATISATMANVLDWLH